MELRYIQGFRMVNALERGFLTHDRIEALLSDQTRAGSFQVVQGRRSQRLRLCGAPCALQQLALSATGYSLLPEDVRLAVLNDPLAVQNMAARILGRDPAEFTFAEIAEFVNDETVMTVVFTSYPASQILASSETAMTAIASSPAALLVLGRHVEGLSAVMESELAVRILVSSVVAMDALSVSATALQAIWQSQIAWSAVAADGMAVGKYVAGSAELNPVTYADIGAVASSATAMSAVASVLVAMEAICSSAVAIRAVLRNKASCWIINSSPHAANLADKVQGAGLASAGVYGASTGGSSKNTVVINSKMPQGVCIVTASSGEAFSYDKLEIAMTSGIKVQGGVPGIGGYCANTPQSVYIESTKRVVFVNGGEYLYLHNDGSSGSSHTLMRYY